MALEGVRSPPPAKAANLAVAPLDPAIGAQLAKTLGVSLTNPDKVVYPGTRITKSQLCTYYAAVLDRMLPHLTDRPLSLVRTADEGLDATFFQKHRRPGHPRQIHDGQLRKLSGKESRILWIDDLAGLLAGVQMNVREFHVWGSSRQLPDMPHRLVFDIDPDEGLGFGHVRQAALDIRDILQALGLRSYPLLSGGKGIHVVVPIRPTVDWTLAKAFCQDFAELLALTDRTRFVANMSKAKRSGRMFLDYLRNGQGATAICPWSTRARAGASVAVPVGWEELGTFAGANTFNVFAAAARAYEPDPWSDYSELDQQLTDRILQAVRR